MPNWVYNGLTVIGEPAEVDRLLEQGSRPYETRHTDFRSGERVVETVKPEFAFYNFVRPAEDRLDAYFSTADADAPGDNWYAWNINHWGTKWDAQDAQVERFADDHALIRFSTAWSPPEAFLVAVSSQFPTLAFTLEWEEEQGFGGETYYENGTSEDVRSWDIPDSHADHDERERECVCSYEDDTQYWFDDCPRPKADPQEEIARGEILETVSEMV